MQQRKSNNWFFLSSSIITNACGLFWPKWPKYNVSTFFRRSIFKIIVQLHWKGVSASNLATWLIHHTLYKWFKISSSKFIKHSIPRACVHYIAISMAYLNKIFKAWLKQKISEFFRKNPKKSVNFILKGRFFPMHRLLDWSIYCR